MKLKKRYIAIFIFILACYIVFSMYQIENNKHNKKQLIIDISSLNKQIKELDVTATTLNQDLKAKQTELTTLSTSLTDLNKQLDLANAKLKAMK